MTGDLNDCLQRLRLTLPARWFADVSPVLDGVLNGISSAWSSLYGLLQFVRLQTRIRTVTGDILDLVAADYFDELTRRRISETDGMFRARLLQAMRRQRATRTALVDVAASSGFSIQVFEAARPADTGAYNVSTGLAWGVAGAWGSYEMPLECLITARPGSGAIEAQFWRDMAASVPAGGAAWVRVIR